MAIENEIKVLEINPEEVCRRLEELGAQKVFDSTRTITHFDTVSQDLTQAGKSLKLTEEGDFKLTATTPVSPGIYNEIKTKIGNTKELLEILATLGFSPIAEVQAPRISYELHNIDYDIDFFPGIAPFLEIDLESAPTQQAQLLQQLGLENNRVVTLSTPEIFQEYGKNYFEEFKISSYQSR